ncbi:1,4-dihydroxy-2-naphthoate polyprenyltransferase [Streptococcus sp. 20-1249]|uniref:1,4-dihydroxy-2-naphthoate polyprenyltransferase n=1 Tax=Streptococcus hepaticus TaxID=3349163 RepID=UPI0037495B7E
MQNKLTLPVFLEFVELKTKVASVFPMMIGLLWSSYAYGPLNWVNTFLFIIAVLSFDMCTTAINNAMDYHKAVDAEYKAQENVIGKHGLDFQQMMQIIFILLGIAVLFSVFLVFRTDLLLLPIGGLCFLIGIFYTFGPMPLSRLPLGEIFSGVTMGFGIFFLAVYIQNPSAILASGWDLRLGTAAIAWNWFETIKIFFMTIPLICLIANIMLANNLCDYEQDLRNHRFTLVHYIRPKLGVVLYTVLSWLPWVLWVIYGLTGLLPIWTLIGFIGLVPFTKNLKNFQAKQIKRETFINSIKNFVLFSAMYLMVLVFALLFK